MGKRYLRLQKLDMFKLSLLAAAVALPAVMAADAPLYGQCGGQVREKRIILTR